MRRKIRLLLRLAKNSNTLLRAGCLIPTSKPVWMMRFNCGTLYVLDALRAIVDMLTTFQVYAAVNTAGDIVEDRGMFDEVDIWLSARK